MTEALVTPDEGEDDLAAERRLVDLAGAARRDEQAAALRAALAVVAWAQRFGTLPESADDGTVVEAATTSDVFTETDVPIAGKGAPLVPEFRLVGLCAALGLGKHAGRNHVGNVIELAWRLPRTWAQVQGGRCALWRACRIAEQTRSLSPEGAAMVDRALAGFAGSCSPAQVERSVAAAVAATAPDRAQADAAAAAEQRHVTLHFDDPKASLSGVVFGDLALDHADALDLEAAVADGAAELGRFGSTESLDVRRSMALGELARRDAVLELGATVEADAPPRRPRRKVVLHVHLSERAVTGAGDSALLARVDEIAGPVTAQQVRDWCGTAGTVLVRPVLDLADHTAVDSYEVPKPMRRQVVERDRHCVFPHCTHPALRCDLDHIDAYRWGDQGPPASGDPPPGQTRPENLAPLCRLHHRIKTHGDWTYRMLHPGTYLWGSPTGHHYLVDAAGTHGIDLR